MEVADQQEFCKLLTELEESGTNSGGHPVEAGGLPLQFSLPLQLACSTAICITQLFAARPLSLLRLLLPLS